MKIIVLLLFVLFLAGCNKSEEQSNTWEDLKKKELELKEKELQLKEKELNDKKELEQKELGIKERERELREKELKNNNSNENRVNINILEGSYQVGNTHCTISRNAGKYIIDWDKGAGYNRIVEEEDDGAFIYTEYDKYNNSCGFFAFNHNFRNGIFIRADLKEFSVTKIK